MISPSLWGQPDATGSGNPSLGRETPADIEMQPPLLENRGGNGFSMDPGQQPQSLRKTKGGRPWSRRPGACAPHPQKDSFIRFPPRACRNLKSGENKHLPIHSLGCLLGSHATSRSSDQRKGLHGMLQTWNSSHRHHSTLEEELEQRWN